MRLSEAIMLGYVQITFTPHSWLYAKEGRLCGCLLGAGLIGSGYRLLNTQRVPPDFKERWPWLQRSTVYPCSKPCAVMERIYAEGRPRVFGERMNHTGTVHAVVSHIAHHVDIGDWTLERAVDWIRSIEPAEEVDWIRSIEPAEEEHAPAEAVQQQAGVAV